MFTADRPSHEHNGGRNQFNISVGGSAIMTLRYKNSAQLRGDFRLTVSHQRTVRGANSILRDVRLNGDSSDKYHYFI
jgi:hypothetical protein